MSQTRDRPGRTEGDNTLVVALMYIIVMAYLAKLGGWPLETVTASLQTVVTLQLARR